MKNLSKKFAIKFITISGLMVSQPKIRAVGLSDIGLVRQNNEDVWAIVPELNIYILADGMGGHQAGEIAAREAVNSLIHLVKKAYIKDHKPLSDAAKILEHAIETVNSVIFRMGKQYPDLRGMGTTLCCLQIHPEAAILAHVGDSRIYRIRNGEMEPMTKDHSLLSELVELGQLSEENTSEFMYKNILTRAIGTEPSVTPNVIESDIKMGDIFLLCTDGLSDMMSQKEIEKIILSKKSIEEAAKELVEESLNRGGLDNVTVLLVQIEETDADKDILRQ